ncbi:MAG TPA: T9SS type A sorting domain-containing protein [Chitinophagaceae bacterium]|nr:T9SS type A sorting domain-containing protein [Chitinophagaceae bacterium]
MKWQLLMALLVFGDVSCAQLNIAPGGKLSISGNIEITLQDMDLVNDGTFDQTDGVVNFTGINSTSVAGSQQVQFSQIKITKTNNRSLILSPSVEIDQRIIFHSGFLDLNGFNVDLGTSGFLDGEQESSRVVGKNGGEIFFSTNLTSPSNANPANLGVIISSHEDLGNVIIRRGHQSQISDPGSVKSILRYYDIRPTNNTNLNAKIRFTYFNGELDGIDENALALFKSQDGTNWSFEGNGLKDTVFNFQENTLTSLSRFTLFPILSPLPVTFTQFNASCELGKTIITWKTAQEQNTDHYEVERSNDGIHWAVIGQVAVSMSSSVPINYSFADDAGANNFYRVAEYDVDRTAHYTGTIKSPCGGVADLLSIWPNPFRGNVTININTSRPSKGVLKLYDSKGSLIKIVTVSLFPGNNQLNVDLESLPKGNYLLQAEWSNNQMSKTSIISKQ